MVVLTSVSTFRRPFSDLLKLNEMVKLMVSIQYKPLGCVISLKMISYLLE